MNKARPWPFNFALILAFFTLYFSNSTLFAQNVYCEVNGMLVVEIESETPTGDWLLKTDEPGYTGTGYYIWDGINRFGTPGFGVLSYSINITTPGTYRFRWKSLIGTGTQKSEHNDGWLRIPDADAFYGYKPASGSYVYPKGSGLTPNPKGASADGWFKVFMNSLNSWQWTANTSDNDVHQIFATFNNPGIYTVEISGRSTQFAIDKFVLYQQSTWSLNDVKVAATSPINCGFFYQDLDNDGYGNPAVTSNSPQAGYVAQSGDCNDNNASINPGAIEICGNVVDENCDGITEIGSIWYEDFDNDGYGNPAVTQTLCTQPAGYVAQDGDCNDTNVNVNPGMIEICGNNVDENCDGITDLGNTWYEDFDNDGYGNPAVTQVLCTQPVGYVAQDGDCNDTNVNVNPGMIEICGNNVDENCDGITDLGSIWYEDFDNDGFGNPAVSQTLCSQPIGYVADNTDCNDILVTTYPGANEIAGDGIDNDCDGQVDEVAGTDIFRLINANDETIIQALSDGDIVGINGLPTNNLNIDFITSQSAGSVVYSMTGAETVIQNENTAPYALFGDAGGDFNIWNPTLGNYALTAEVYSGKNGGGSLLLNVTINFTVQQAATSFPVNWLNFEAKQEGNQVNLIWQTASEQNSSHFVVERSEANQFFTAIGEVEAAGNSDQVSSYQLADPEPKTGVFQYRVKQVDFDGQYSYSSTVEINFKASDALQLFPNPSVAGTPLYLRGSLAQSRDVNLVMINSTGKTVWQKEHFPLSNRGSTLSIPVLPAGIYFLRVQNASETYALKLMIRP